MRILLIVCLTLFLSMLPVAHAQHNEFPPCSDSSLAAFADMQGTYDALNEALQSATSREGFQVYIQAYFSWRRQLESQLPQCAELLEIATLMNHIAGNHIATYALDAALRRAGRPMAENAYRDPELGAGDLPNALALRIEEVQAQLGDVARVSPDERAQAPCSDADHDIFYAEVFDGYIPFIESVTGDRSVRHLLSQIVSMLEWRGRVWQRLPDCEDMAEITWLIMDAAGDLTVMLSFFLADMAPEFRLYEQETARISATVAEMTPAFLGQEALDAKPPETTLPHCAKAQLQDFIDIIVEYSEMTAAAENIVSLVDVIDYGKRHFAWREKRFTDLPRCAEAFTLGLLFDQATSDLVLAFSLFLSGADADAIPHLAEIQEGSAKMSALVTPIIRGERSGSEPALARRLPICTEAQLGVISAEIEPQYQEAMTVAEAAETIDDVLEFGRLQIAFRDGVWRQLPACGAAYDIAWLMYRITGDTALTLALQFAGAADEDIPFAAQVPSNEGRLYMLLSDVPD